MDWFEIFKLLMMKQQIDQAQREQDEYSAFALEAAKPKPFSFNWGGRDIMWNPPTLGDDGGTGLPGMFTYGQPRQQGSKNLDEWLYENIG